eukprot:11214700-Lingulodinium_polyedra.AAC.1
MVRDASAATLVIGHAHRPELAVAGQGVRYGVARWQPSNSPHLASTAVCNSAGSFSDRVKRRPYLPPALLEPRGGSPSLPS